MRVAYFGGSFDPPHRGHISIARAAADHFGLDRVLFAPTGRQPLKPQGARASFADRLKMVELACVVDPRFVATKMDAPRSDGGPNYTVDALESLRRSLPEARIYTILGADSFLELPRWHMARQLVELSEWIVISRPGFSLEEIADSEQFAMRPGSVLRLETVKEDVSASELRRRLALGDPCTGLLSTTVFEYIADHKLYGFVAPL